MKIHFLILLAVVFLGSACSVNKLITDANNSFLRKEYFTATEKYRLANQKVKDKSQKPALFFNLAESYRLMGDYTKAAIWYKNAIRSGCKDSIVEMLYADALRGAGKSEEAKPIYEAEVKKASKNVRAVNGMESIRHIQQWKEVQELYLIENLKSVNSVSNDLAVQVLPAKDQTICLRSSREDIPDKRINPATGQKFAGFFISAFDSAKQKWSVPTLLKEPASVNSPAEELALNFDPSSQLVVFTREVKQPLKQAVSQMFFMLKTGGQWTNPELVPFTKDGADYLQPMITLDGKTLWFASNRSGGKGGFDIWKSTISGAGAFSDPENAGGEINTLGNEVCPFQKPNGFLYFSSDFHGGIGGFDIFQAQKNNSDKWQIEQLPPPVNSAGDDLGILFSGNEEKGFFSSNRKGSRGFDIYSFYLPPKLFQCFGKIHDSETDSVLSDVNIRIVGSDGSSQKIRSVNGRFQASLNPGNDYAIVVFANGYLNAQAKVSTRGLRQAKEFEVDIKPVPTNKPIRIDNINYELGKWELLPQAKSSLDKLIDLLKLNPGAVIEISSHTDDLGDDQFNLELSEKRAASVVQYLKERGIPDKNLKARGYGESAPMKVTQKIAKTYSFLHEGSLLNAGTIDNLENEKLKEIARGLNRRTEFRVLQAGSVPDSK